VSLVEKLRSQMSLPVIAAPMFIVSNPNLVIAQCISGVVGSFPALNARPAEMLDEWITSIEIALAERRRTQPQAKTAPFAVNQIIHQSNDRLDRDLDVCMRHRVPIIITSLRAPTDVVKRVHEYGGAVFHDVISIRHAEKALEAGVDGLVLVCAGAGGHAGMLSPFALVREVRRFFDGPIALSGAITDGAGVLAAEAIGADFAYIGTRFIATREANAVDTYKQMIVQSSAADILLQHDETGLLAHRAVHLGLRAHVKRALQRPARLCYLCCAALLHSDHRRPVRATSHSPRYGAAVQGYRVPCATRRLPAGSGPDRSFAVDVQTELHVAGPDHRAPRSARLFYLARKTTT